MWDMEHEMLLNDVALLSHPIMLSYDTMKTPHWQTAKLKSQRPTGEGVFLFMMTGLYILSVVALLLSYHHLPQHCQLQSIIFKTWLRIVGISKTNEKQRQQNADLSRFFFVHVFYPTIGSEW